MRNKCFKSGKTSFPNFLCLEIGRSRNTPDEYIILTRCVYREWRRNGCERGLKRVINRGRQGRRVVEGNGGAAKGRRKGERKSYTMPLWIRNHAFRPPFLRLLCASSPRACVHARYETPRRVSPSHVFTVF